MSDAPTACRLAVLIVDVIDLVQLTIFIALLLDPLASAIAAACSRPTGPRATRR